MKYLHGTGIFLAIIGGLYMTRAVWENKEYQAYSEQIKRSQTDFYGRRAQAKKSRDS